MSDNLLVKNARPMGGAAVDVLVTAGTILRVVGLAVLLAGAGLLGSASPSAPQITSRPVRIGVLFPDTLAARAPMLDARPQGPRLRGESPPAGRQYHRLDRRPAGRDVTPAPAPQGRATVRVASRLHP